jgi:hypothetical protein
MIQVQVIVEKDGFHLSKLKVISFTPTVMENTFTISGLCIFDSPTVIVYHDLKTDTKTTFVKQMHVK